MREKWRGREGARGRRKGGSEQGREGGREGGRETGEGETSILMGRNELQLMNSHTTRKD